MSTADAHADVSIPTERGVLPGMLVMPMRAAGMVLFAHGSGSSRHSSRNRFVAGVLRQAGLGTLLFDLLTEPEASERRNVFDIDLLAERLLAAVRWTIAHPLTCNAPIGLFGASTGAAAALVAAAQEPLVRAVVSRGGRPDLAGDWLGQVRAPTLLIVGARDEDVLELNRQALAELRCAKHLSIVAGATHLFEEPGALEEAARLAKEWFSSHVARGTPE